MDDPRSLSLTAAEAAVLAELARPRARLPGTAADTAYRRMLELVRTDDDIDVPRTWLGGIRGAYDGYRPAHLVPRRAQRRPE